MGVRREVRILRTFKSCFVILIWASEFAHGTIEPAEAGRQGGLTSGSAGGQYSGVGSGGGQAGGEDNLSLNDVLTMVIVPAEFAHGKVDPAEAGRKGGLSSGEVRGQAVGGSSSDGGKGGGDYQPLNDTLMILR